jgi:hypothetical protein
LPKNVIEIGIARVDYNEHPEKQESLKDFNDANDKHSEKIINKRIH